MFDLLYVNYSSIKLLKQKIKHETCYRVTSKYVSHPKWWGFVAYPVDRTSFQPQAWIMPNPWRKIQRTQSFSFSVIVLMIPWAAARGAPSHGVLVWPLLHSLPVAQGHSPIREIPHYFPSQWNCWTSVCVKGKNSFLPCSQFQPFQGRKRAEGPSQAACLFTAGSSHSWFVVAGRLCRLFLQVLT